MTKAKICIRSIFIHIPTIHLSKALQDLTISFHISLYNTVCRYRGTLEEVPNDYMSLPFTVCELHLSLVRDTYQFVIQCMSIIITSFCKLWSRGNTRCSSYNWINEYMIPKSSMILREYVQFLRLTDGDTHHNSSCKKRLKPRRCPVLLKGCFSGMTGQPMFISYILCQTREQHSFIHPHSIETRHIHASVVVHVCV